MSFVTDLNTNLTTKFAGDATTTTALPKIQGGTATELEITTAAIALATAFVNDHAYAYAITLLADQLFAIRTKIQDEGTEQVQGHFYQLVNEFKRLGKEKYPQVPHSTLFPLSFREADLAIPTYRLKIALHVLDEYASTSTITPKLLSRVSESLLVPFP